LTYNGDTKTSEVAYLYNLPNKLPTEIYKKGHLTDFITESYEYDNGGNVIKKTISAEGVTPRIVTNEYDMSKRFLIKSTNIEGLSKTYTYNTSNGWLLSDTSPFGQVTQHFYDVWGKKVKTTDYLGNDITFSYTKPEANTLLITSSTSGTGGSAISKYDDLGREIVSGTKNIDDSWSFIKTKYDIYDRKISIGEPVNQITTAPTQFTTNTYDLYGRLINNTLYTGRTTNFAYSGLTTTASDGIKNLTTVKNAIGNVISSNDNGGTIYYTYFADANLKSSNFDGTIINLEYDGWGRKTKTVDPSAGTYTYEYNKFGELLKEVTPKGTTSFVVNGVGKITEKTIIGDLTNSIAKYTYDPISKLQTKIEYNDILNSTTIDYDYTYDTQKRLTKTVENNTTKGIVFETRALYDAYGRVQKNYYSANKGTIGQNKWVSYNYKNGLQWQIIDDATNTILWQANTVNSKGQLTNTTLGNGISISNTYDPYGYISQAKHEKSNNGVTTDVMTLNTIFEPTTANLTSRTNSMFNWTESFKYDTLDRLTEYTNEKGVQVTQTYDKTGRIDENTIGKYNYTNTAKKYQNTSITLNTEGNKYYNDLKEMFFDDMETQSGWSNATFGDWAIGVQPAIAYDNVIKKNGNYSVKLSNTITTEKVLHSEKVIAIDNSEDTYYQYSGWVYTDNPTADIFVIMKTATETNYHTIANNIYIDNTQKNVWRFVNKYVLVPKNITKLNIRLDVNSTGNVWFDDIKLEKVYIKNRKLQEVKYNVFKSPVEIYSEDADRIFYEYNAFNGRSASYSGNTSVNKSDKYYQKFYSADGSMEFTYNVEDNESNFKTFIGGDAYTAKIVIDGIGTTDGTSSGDYLYLHRDYQGSIMAITNSSGTLLQKRLYDAWGLIIKTADGNGNNNNVYLFYLDRGYTGHEHLQSVELIHMNGRLYDPKLHRFLQPDNNIQDPHNTQNYNRYGYVLNNPNKYTDPSGEFWGFVAGFLFSAYVHGAQSSGEVNPVKWSSGTWTNLALGASSSAASNLLTNLSNNFMDKNMVSPDDVPENEIENSKYVNKSWDTPLESNTEITNLWRSGAKLYQTGGSVYTKYYKREGRDHDFNGSFSFLKGNVYASNGSESGGIDQGVEGSLISWNINNRIGSKNNNFHSNTVVTVAGIQANINAGILSGQRDKVGVLFDGNLGAYTAKADFTIGGTIFGATYDASFTGSIYSAHIGYTNGIYVNPTTNTLTYVGGEHLGFGIGEGASVKIEIPLSWLPKSFSDFLTRH
jgi:RHS repeat-associated protein